jgi:D-Tyr-tRNAtyr deacylase
MRAVIQRVTRAAVRVEGEVVGSIRPGRLVLVGLAQGDGPEEARRLASKTAGLRKVIREQLRESYSFDVKRWLQGPPADGAAGP